MRLSGVERRIDALDGDGSGIPAVLSTLNGIANRVSLIERSHLGEFSWPFANAIRAIADKLLVEKSLKGELVPPIFHMIAEGTGYNIRNERSTDIDARRRIAIVAFPRQLKHHVLMHAIFGHELGHAAFYTNVAGRICKRRVIQELRRRGPLANAGALAAWLNADDAPQALRDRLAKSTVVKVQDSQIAQWSLELMCDLFGLLLFGPAFAAAHRTLLEPASRPSDDIELRGSTHPPLSVRRRMLTQAMSVLGWDQPTVAEPSPVRDAELGMLDYIMNDGGDPWATLFDRDQLTTAIGHLRTVFDLHPTLMAEPPEGEVTTALVCRLAKRLQLEPGKAAEAQPDATDFAPRADEAQFHLSFEPSQGKLAKPSEMPFVPSSTP